MTSIHSSAPFASISPALTGGLSGRSATQIPSAGGFLAFLNSSVGQAADEPITMPGSGAKAPGSAKKDVVQKSPGDLFDATALPFANLPPQPNSKSPLRLPLSFSSATDQRGTDTETDASNSADGGTTPNNAEGDTNADAKRASLNALISQTSLYSVAVPQMAVRIQLQAAPAVKEKAVARDARSTPQANVAAQSAPGEVAQTASDLATTSQTVPVQPEPPQATSIRLPLAADSTTASQSLSSSQPEITTSLDEPRVETGTRTAGDSHGELAFALRLRQAESITEGPPAVSSAMPSQPESPVVSSRATEFAVRPEMHSPVPSSVRSPQPPAELPKEPAAGDIQSADMSAGNSVAKETPEAAGVTTGIPDNLAPNSRMSVVEPRSTESPNRSGDQLTSSAAGTPAGSGVSATNGVTRAPGADSGAQQNSERDGHEGGNHDANSATDPKHVDPQPMTAPIDSTLIHGQGLVGTGSAQGSPGNSIATTPKAPTTAASDSPASAAPVVADDNPAVGPAHQISLSVPSGNDQKVEIRLTERAGEILVSVRTPDQTLAHSLRDDLGSLTGKLNQSGYSTEAFAPTGSAGSNLSDRGADRRGTSDERESDGGQKQNTGQQSSGDEQQSGQNGRGKRPAWLEQLNLSMASRQLNRSK